MDRFALENFTGCAHTSKFLICLAGKCTRFTVRTLPLHLSVSSDCSLGSFSFSNCILTFSSPTKALINFIDKVQWKSLKTNHKLSSLNSTIRCHLAKQHLFDLLTFQLIICSHFISIFAGPHRNYLLQA